jgi:hypothetical protein
MEKSSSESPLPAASAPDSGAVPAPVESSPGGAATPVEPVALRPDTAREGRLALGIAGLYLLFWQLVSFIPGHMTAVVITTLISLLLVLLFTVRAARALCSPKALVVTTLVAGALTIPPLLVMLFSQLHPGWGGWHALAPLLAVIFLPQRIPGLSGLLMILFAACIGVWLSRILREVKILLPIAVVLALVDMYVVFGGGLVTQAQSGRAPVARAAMHALMVSLPTTQPKGGAAPMQLAVGFADFLFIALFFASFVRFGIPARRTFSMLYSALALYMVFVAMPQLLGLTDLALPALVPIAVVVIGMNLRQFRYDRSEAFALLYAGLIVAAVAGIFYFASHR